MSKTLGEMIVAYGYAMYDLGGKDERAQAASGTDAEHENLLWGRAARSREVAEKARLALSKHIVMPRGTV